MRRTQRPSANHAADRRAALLALALLCQACGIDPERSPGLQTEREVTGLRLRLEATPVQGEAPLTVRFEAELLGDPTDPSEFECPTLAWTLDARDDGQVLLAQAEDCRPGEVARRFTLEHRYTRARSYEASMRLIGLGVPPSNVVQLLVAGPTATAPPQVAQPGPTIVIAAPATRPSADPTRLAAAPAPSDGATASPRPGATPSPRPSDRPLAPTATAKTRPTTAPPSPRPSPSSAPSRQARVLPADLYYLDAASSLWRLPAEGEDPIRISPTDALVEGYAVSIGGRVAYSAGGQLILLEGRDARVIAEGTIGRVLVWSPDGLRLAYIAGALRVHDIRSGRDLATELASAPLAWSADGGQLLALGPGGQLQRIQLDTDRVEARDLPIDGVTSAGWLPGREAVWLAGAGLRLLTLEPSLQLTEILPPEQRTEALLARSDDRLLLLSTEAGRRQPRIVDLTARQLRAEPLGPELADASLELVFAPGGRLAALAGPDGLALFDPVGGGRVSLLRRPVRAPSWSLARP